MRGARDTVGAMESLVRAIETFVADALEPVVMEPGEPFIELAKEHYVLERRGERLTLQVWDEHRNLVRRILRVEQQSRGRMRLVVEKFARREGTIELVDRGRPATFELQRKGSRMVFRERLRLFLRREFPEWKIAELTSEANLEHSLSAAFPRALLRRGNLGWAAIGASPEVEDPGSCMAFGLIWLDYLRRRERKLTIEGLVMVVPAARASAVSLRVPFLNHTAARFELLTYSDEDYAARLDPADYGNVQTVLEPPVSREVDIGIAGVEATAKADGSVSVRVHGWEIARLKQAPSEARRREIQALAESVSGLSGSNPLHRPEAWLESIVRARLGVIDATLRTAPVYGQAPTFAAGRGVIDLLACDQDGRLAVIELKAAADLQLPIQALDYWLRVKWHLDRGEFGARGYFPGVELRRDPPKLLLVAPAFEFHPTSENILRYLAPDIWVERIGIGANWRQELRVLFRALGSEPPAQGTWKESGD